MYLKFKFACLLALIFSSNVVLHADELDFSQYKGKSYEVVKREFLSSGWQLVPNQEGETSISEHYPEVTCGSGIMAICSVGFTSKQNSIAFIVVESQSELIISGEY